MLSSAVRAVLPGRPGCLKSDAVNHCVCMCVFCVYLKVREPPTTFEYESILNGKIIYKYIQNLQGIEVIFI